MNSATHREAWLPTVDVIICALNEEKRIGSCIQSLIAQDYPPGLVTIHVVDNGSKDRTADVVRGFPVRLLDETIKGSAAARNLAFSNATGELVAFFDAHCIANPRWISEMVKEFADSRVGGAQACISNAATDPRVLGYLEERGMTDNDIVLEDTVYGASNIYPWILSGNCMYRRTAVARVAGFDASLPACEDVDLAWKVVLSGYLLSYCSNASVVHWNDDDWKSFVKKSWRQGRGSAVLARRYLPHGARNAFKPAMIWGNGRDHSLIALRYWAGYRYEAARLAAGRSRASRGELPSIDESTRKEFSWTSKKNLSISPDTIYWFRADSTSIAVHVPTRSRLTLDETADFIWRRITAGARREDLSRDLATTYAIDLVDAEADIDEFVDELLRLDILRSRSTAV